MYNVQINIIIQLKTNCMYEIQNHMLKKVFTVNVKS